MSRSVSNIVVVHDSKLSFSAADLWRYRELLYFLTWRDIKVRYKQTILGLVWVIIQPLTIALMLSVFLGRFTKVPSDGIAYPVFAYVAMVPWQFFANSLAAASNSLLGNEKLITKVYFPRLVIPLSAIVACLVDLAVALLLMLPLFAYYRVAITVTILTLPFFVALAAMTSLGVGLWLSALNVRYRDVRHTIAFVLQAWFFVSPVAYPTNVVPEPWRLVYALNPMVSVIDGFRWAIFGIGEGPGRLLAVSIAATAIFLTSGLYYFRQTEDTFADVI